MSPNVVAAVNSLKSNMNWPSHPTGRFVPAFIKTGQVMPAGLMSVLSVIGVIMAIVAWIKK